MKPSQSSREDAHLATMYPAPRSHEHDITVPCRRLTATAKLPRYAHDGDAGADLYSDEDCDVYSMTSKLVRTNFAAAISPGYVGLCCSRSGLALRKDVVVLNAPGVVDAPYRGSQDVILANFGSTTFQVRRGDRIAQLVVVPVARCRFVEVAELAATGRGVGGFGSSGS